MKPLLVLIVGLMTVGCVTLTPEEHKALRDSVAGIYETKEAINRPKATRIILLKNGVAEYYLNGIQEHELEWEISEDGKLHTIGGSRRFIYNINSDGGLTYIAHLFVDGKRGDFSKDKQETYKKIN